MVMCRKNFKRAFTLVELLVVCIIIAILSSIAVSSFNSYSDFAVQSRLEVLVDQLNHAQSVYKAENLFPRNKPLSESATVDELFVLLRPYIPALSEYSSYELFKQELMSKARVTQLSKKIVYKKAMEGFYKFSLEEVSDEKK